MDQMIEQTSVEIDAAKARFYKLQDRTAKNFGYGATNEGLHIAQSCFDRLATVLDERLSAPVVPSKGWDEKVHRILKTIPPHVISLSAIHLALTAAIDEKSHVWLCSNLGKHLSHEVFAKELHDYDEKLKEKIEKWVKEKHGNLKVRNQAARSIAKKQGFSLVNEWKPNERVAVGHFVVDIMLEALSDLFISEMEGDTRMIRVTEKACGMASDAMKQYIRFNPIFLPSMEPLLSSGTPAVAHETAVLMSLWEAVTAPAMFGKEFLRDSLMPRMCASPWTTPSLWGG
jgi:DNA-directed RNA polymerase